MKISNVILVLFFASCLFFISAFTLVVNRHYSNGKYDLEGDLAGDFVWQTLTRCSVVKIKNLSQVTIIPSDSFAIAVEKSAVDIIQYSFLGDTLTISGMGANTLDAPVKLYCPAMNLIRAHHSSLVVKGVLRRGDPWISYNFELNNATLSTNKLPLGLRIYQHYQHLFVNGKDSARVNIFSGTVVQHLKISNIPNVLIEREVRINKFETEYRNKAKFLSTSADGKTEIHAQ
jgi:hypothetical protein